MTGQLLDLDASRHESRVLSSWIAGRDGAAERAGIVAFGENSTRQLTMGELANLLGRRAPFIVRCCRDGRNRHARVGGLLVRVAGRWRDCHPAGRHLRTERWQPRDRADHDYWWMFNEKACDGWTSAAAWEYLIASKLLVRRRLRRVAPPELRTAIG
jgi:hypothetical protein